MADVARRIVENLAVIRQRISEAAERAGRSAAEVTLVAVTKYVGDGQARTLAEAGCLDLGESRPQQLWRKAEALVDLPIRWHLIGHLQRNKVHRTLPLVAMIHSADSRRVLQAIDETAGNLGRRVRVLLEVNMAGESAKHGFAPHEIERLLPWLSSLEHVHVAGLMAMAALDGGAKAARAAFRGLRELRDAAIANCPANVALDELSMGMSGDFEIAVEEGATIVRVGSALFEGLSD